MKFVVIGAGSWGTTLANIIGNNGHQVTLWAREPEVVEGINNQRHNPYFVSHLKIHENVTCVNNLSTAIKGASYGLLSIPSSFIKAVIEPHKEELLKLKGILNVAKGFEFGTGRRISEMICDVLSIVPGSEQDIVASLSGPNIADEVARGQIGATVIASPCSAISQIFQDAISTDCLRIYTQTDRTGVELGGTLKNIFAIGAGIVDGLKLGDNAKAAYLTRSLHELVKLGTALGGQPTTFYGLAGLGDLITTANSSLSRNHRLGEAIAQGVTLEEYLGSTKMVVEGVEATKIALTWSKRLNIPLPITEELSRVLFDNVSPQLAASNLMKRALKPETE
jgi:glycerol-3-phosphate dehydrogenase (NAD(P)+)